MQNGRGTGGYERSASSDYIVVKSKEAEEKIGRRERKVENMGVGLIFKIAAVGILITILSQVLKHSGREEHAFLISLAGLILVLTWIVPYIYELFMTIQSLFSL